MLCRLAWPLLLCLASLYHVSLAQKPEMTLTRFANLPMQLSYFEDSPVVVYHDIMEGTVWISDNEGKDWDQVKGISSGKAAMFYLHPFDSRMAFILTGGDTHYRTTDRGKTWQSFKVPAPPAFSADTLTFHSKEPGRILYQAKVCASEGWWGGMDCHHETFYTLDAFESDVKSLLSPTTYCRFAHSSKDFKHSAHVDLVFCVAPATTTSGDYRHSKLFASVDFFTNDKRAVSLPGGNRDSDGVVGLAIVSKFAVVAVKDMTPGSRDEMLMFVSEDAETWTKGHFPHASSSKLRENAYTIVESTTHSLAVDVLLHPKAEIGTLFVSNSNGTYFVQSLQNTNRNSAGFVDYENVYGIEGVGLANIVANALEVDGRDVERIIKSLITFDDGSNWTPIRAPSKDNSGKDVGCDTSHPSTCSLHLHSVTNPHNFGRIFSSPAPGFVIGVGNVGEHLLPYEQCDTFLSMDAGLTWRMIHKDAHIHGIGDQGSVIVIVDDEEAVDHISYSYDSGKTWNDFDLGLKIRARVLATIPDSTSQKFLLIGMLHKSEHRGGQMKHATIFLDFAPLRKEQCKENQLEKWYARTSKGKECVMGHKQWYWRKIADADCFVGNKFQDPVEHEENCPCDEDDYECDFNFVREDDTCTPQGPEPIPAGVCEDPDSGQTYLGSSGYRLVPGNTCDRSRGVKKDAKVEKSCSQAQLPPGKISHQTFQFPAQVVQLEYFQNSKTVLVRLADGTVWQSSNEGYTWRNPMPNERFDSFYLHRYARDRAYLLTNNKKIYGTVDTGKTWQPIHVNYPANNLGINVIGFHPMQSDWLIWVGSTPGCYSTSRADCHAEAEYTTDHGKSWSHLDSFVKDCAWARDTDLRIDSRLVICQSYRDKVGSQLTFDDTNPVELWIGSDFYRSKKKVFDNVVGFTKFSEYLIVAELQTDSHELKLQVSLDGKTFANGLFPPKMQPNNHAYTVLESTTDSVFLHLTISDRRGAEYGPILKSNSNGTFYGVSIENVNRNVYGYVDFEKMIGLDGIALANIVANPDDIVFGQKKLRSRITHNDGGFWKALTPPSKDSNGQEYPCTSTACSLHVHGYTERWDPRATYSTPSVPGLMMAVGNVGESLAAYTESDTFLSRDAGFTWEEVHKDAHLWEFGDSGSILIMANDEVPTDHVLFSTDQGLNWKEYNFGERIRVKSILTVPEDTSRKFILFGYPPGPAAAAVAVHVDFSSLTKKRCLLDVQNSANDDFELWSPSEEREEKCLFGRQTLYHRRIRDRDCYVGEQVKDASKSVQNCTCTDMDFECEFNHARDADGKCVLGAGLSPLPSDDTACRLGDDYWYDRTAYRKIPYSTCSGGARPDHGTSHVCPGPKRYGFWFWTGVLLVPFGFCAFAGWWYTKKSGLARGTIRLPDQRHSFPDSGPLATLASIPYFILGLTGIAWEYVVSRLPSLQSRRGYRNVPVDEDAQVLRFEDED